MKKISNMKATSPLLFLIFSIILFSCQQKESFGQYTEADCPIEIPEELRNGGKFTYG